MSDLNYIPLAKPRSWTETLSATIDVIRYHYASLLLFVIKHVAPWFLIGAGLTAYGVVTGFGAFMSGDVEAIASAFEDGAFDGMALSGAILGVGYLVVVFVSAWQASIVMTWLRAYHEAGATPSTEQLAEAKALHSGRIFTTMLALMGIGIGALIVLALPVAFLAASAGTIAAIGIVLLAMVVLMPLVLYVTVPLLLVAPISAFNEYGVMECIRQAFRTIRGYWWWLFGYYLVMAFLVGICSYVFSIPDMVVSLFQSFASSSEEGSTVGVISILRVGTTMLSLGGSQLLSTITYAGIGVAYFAILENRHGLGLTAMAEAFAQGQSDHSNLPNTLNATDASDR